MRVLFKIHFVKRLCFSPSGKHGSHPSSFLYETSTVMLWLVEATRVMGSAEPSTGPFRQWSFSWDSNLQGQPLRKQFSHRFFFSRSLSASLLAEVPLQQVLLYSHPYSPTTEWENQQQSITCKTLSFSTSSSSLRERHCKYSSCIWWSRFICNSWISIWLKCSRVDPENQKDSFVVGTLFHAWKFKFLQNSEIWLGPTNAKYLRPDGPRRTQSTADATSKWTVRFF